MDYNSSFWRIRDWFPKLSEQAYHDLRMLHVELLRFNEKINLISVKTIVDADLHHFADAMIFSSIVRSSFNGKVVWDIGSGNGFPGLVMAVLNRDTEFVLLDSDLKKLEFLKYMISTLKLVNARTEWKRIEDIKDESIEFGVSRGFAPLPRALLVTRKAFKKGGVYFHMKSQEWPIEMASLPPQLCSTWNTSFLQDYDLPIGNIRLSILKAEKIK
jgi:16S rRNA (guanine527-N7)-methyltransferase